MSAFSSVAPSFEIRCDIDARPRRTYAVSKLLRCVRCSVFYQLTASINLLGGIRAGGPSIQVAPLSLIHISEPTRPY